MRILFCGDLVGRSGRQVVLDHAAKLRTELALDFLLVNGENAAHGFGITAKICEELFAVGVDAISTGNHVWDQREIIPAIGNIPNLIRPANFPHGTPGRGSVVVTNRAGRKLLLLNVMGRLFMDPLDDPFACVDKLLEPHRLGGTVDAIVVDIHAEATSEKMAMGHYLDGRVSLVVGTHTHVPTADTMVLRGGTAYQSDLGMCGDYDSVIGMSKKNPIARFTRKMPTDRLAPADGEATLCAVFAELDDATGLARSIAPLRLGGVLQETGVAHLVAPAAAAD